MKKILCSSLLMAFGVALVGCAPVAKEMVATGGSKADGVIELSYDYMEMETPTVNKLQGLKTAEKRCQAWGYKRAEAFGGEKTTCTQSPGVWTTCRKYTTTVQYQCMDE
ncbi:YecR family lipoprotein [uncultured Cardiobacterium sp.]|uniref:YecR family lipoprotein n=1 Tax=uncultured Cardiobacterium sp. TaxID=417619 RepID=UPI002618CFCC|nr:YecR family lipoprotein [uncultured Cardiobacterium sp.]